MHSKYIGQTINGFTVLSCFNKKGNNRNYNAYFVARCDLCGKVQTRARTNLLNGQATCECSYKMKRHNTKGQSNTRLNKVYRSMLERCNNPACKTYRLYGARGITVCDEWTKDYQAFFDWSIKNGYKRGLSIDRIDNDKGYCPENCRWTTAKVQTNNRRNIIKIEFRGTVKPAKEWAEETGIPYTTIINRYHRGLPAEKILMKPTKTTDEERRNEK